MAINKDQVKELLGTGLSTEIVASTVGCDPSYISQLMSDADFAEEVVALRAAALTANSKRDRSIDGIEDTLIEKLRDAVDSGLVYRPRDILQSFAVVNNAKRRGVPQHETTIIGNRVVNLNLPKVVVQHFTINIQGEVVEVGNQTLVTMPARELLEKVASGGQGINHDRLKQIASYIPAEPEKP